MDPESPKQESGDGNKIFMYVITALCVIILIVLLLMASGVLMAFGGSAASAAAAGGCGDDNPCTVDYIGDSGSCNHDVVDGPNLACSGPAGLCRVHACSDGSCIIDIIYDCCGNEICEENETAGNCPMDCGSVSSVTTSTDSEGNTYNEFDSGGEAVCSSSASATAEGAICICEENDCDDGLDNDGDGQIDCDDPDCNCEDCPECDGGFECEDLSEPCCRYGDCAPGMRCMPDGRGGCDCISEEGGGCEDIDPVTSPIACIPGECPPGQRCEFRGSTIDASTGELMYPATCECVEDEGGDDCEDSQYPACTGDCPPNQRCVFVSGTVDPSGVIVSEPGCECFEDEGDDCEDSNYPSCTGDCPPNQRCAAIADPSGVMNCDCQPVTANCEDSQYPACTGDCPPNEQCVFVPGQVDVAGVTSEPGCECAPQQQQEVPCEDSYSLQCRGSCPPDMACTRTTWQTCVCQDITVDCEDSQYPACDGDCPRGEYCDDVQGRCQCIDEQQGDEPDDDYDCVGMDTAYCSRGTCPPDETCALMQGYDPTSGATSISCQCMPDQVEYTCQDMDPAACSRGTCPPGEVCTLIQSGATAIVAISSCGCVPYVI